MPVNPLLALAITTPSPLSNGTAVTGRSYGTGSACGALGSTSCAPLEFTATGGTIEGTAGNYVYPGTIPIPLSTAGFTSCATGGGNGANYNCTSSNISATSAISLSSVSVDDAANASAPASSPVSIGSTSLTVNAKISIQQTALTNALVDFNYLNPNGQLVTALNGLGSYTWVPPLGTASGACTVPTGTVPAGLTFPGAPITGTTIALTGTPSSASNPANGDTDFTFGLCVTDTPNQTTPAGFALPNPPTNSFTVNVLNRYAFIADTGANEVRVIKTGESAVVPTTTSITISQTNMQGSVAVTPNGNDAFVPLTGSNGFAVIDTITGAALPKSPFAFPSGATCTSPVGVAFSPDSSKAYFACSGNNVVVEIDISQIAGSSGKVTGVASSTATTPAAIAISPDGSNVYVVTSTPALLIYNAASLVTAPASTSLTSGFSPAAVLATSTTAYIAETKASAPGQVDIVSISGGTGTLASPVMFAASTVSSTTYNPAPSSLAITPDSSRVYVGLQGTDEFAVIATATNTQITNSPFLLPTAAPGSSTTIGSSSPAGIVIPPLFTLPATGYRVFFTSVNGGNGEVDIIDDKNGAPIVDTTSLTNFGASSTPQGIAAIPVPTLP
ncbi:MAG: hypothetical protein ACRD2P_11175 [Terriglobia bacterium]